MDVHDYEKQYVKESNAEHGAALSEYQEPSASGEPVAQEDEAEKNLYRPKAAIGDGTVSNWDVKVVAEPSAVPLMVRICQWVTLLPGAAVVIFCVAREGIEGIPLPILGLPILFIMYQWFVRIKYGQDASQDFLRIRKWIS